MKKGKFQYSFYVEENLIDKLFEEALKKATEEEDLWWHIRPLEEPSWKSELSDLLFKNSNVIEESGDTMMKIHFAKARGNDEEYLELRKEFAKGVRIVKIGHQDKEVEES